MSTDFMDSLFKEVNSQMEKFGSRVSEVFEIRKIKVDIDELIKTRKNKLMELGSLTFRKMERVEDIKESDITKIITEIKDINEAISNKKNELDKIIEEENAKDKSNTGSSKSCDNNTSEKPDVLFCANCGNKTTPQDKFCRQCGQHLDREI